MSDPKQYDDVISMLTDQCHQYALEVERLKAKPHDDDTCPHLVVLGRLEAENARLKAEVRKLTTERDANLVDAGSLFQENARLKAEVERLTAFTTRTIIPNEELKAQVERLTKAGDVLANNIVWVELYRPLVAKWNAAKEGKQP